MGSLEKWEHRGQTETRRLKTLIHLYITFLGFMPPTISFMWNYLRTAKNSEDHKSSKSLYPTHSQMENSMILYGFWHLKWKWLLKDTLHMKCVVSINIYLFTLKGKVRKWKSRWNEIWSERNLSIVGLGNEKRKMHISEVLFSECIQSMKYIEIKILKVILTIVIDTVNSFISFSTDLYPSILKM